MSYPAISPARGRWLSRAYLTRSGGSRQRIDGLVGGWDDGPVKHTYDVQARDDSAWPRGAIPISLVAGLATVVGGGFIVGKASNGWLTELGLLMGLAIAALIIFLGIRRWLTGARFPIGL